MRTVPLLFVMLSACTVNSEPLGHRSDFARHPDASASTEHDSARPRSLEPDEDAGSAEPDAAFEDAMIAEPAPDAAQPQDASEPQDARPPWLVKDSGANPFADSYTVSCTGMADGIAYTYRAGHLVSGIHVECAVHGDGLDLSKSWPQQDPVCHLDKYTIDEHGVYVGGMLVAKLDCKCEAGPCP